VGLRRAFALFLALIAVRMWFSGDRDEARAASSAPAAETPAR
jgi:uncharacterized membrane protein YfcA